MIFTRDTTPATIRRGIDVVSLSTPSTRKRTRMSRPSGSKWMSEAPSSTPWAMIELTSLMTGASSADSRMSVTAASVSSSSSCTASATASSRRDMRLMQRHDVIRRGDDRPQLVAGQQLHVVEGEDVRRIDHRDQQVAVVEADRDRAEAARRLWRDQVRGAEVGLVDVEVDVGEAEPLGGRARELLGA